MNPIDFGAEQDKDSDALLSLIIVDPHYCHRQVWDTEKYQSGEFEVLLQAHLRRRKEKRSPSVFLQWWCRRPRRSQIDAAKSSGGTPQAVEDTGSPSSSLHSHLPSETSLPVMPQVAVSPAWFRKKNVGHRLD